MPGDDPRFVLEEVEDEIADEIQLAKQEAQAARDAAADAVEDVVDDAQSTAEAVNVGAAAKGASRAVAGAINDARTIADEVKADVTKTAREAAGVADDKAQMTAEDYEHMTQHAILQGVARIAVAVDVALELLIDATSGEIRAGLRRSLYALMGLGMALTGYGILGVFAPELFLATLPYVMGGASLAIAAGAFYMASKVGRTHRVVRLVNERLNDWRDRMRRELGVEPRD